MNWPKHEAGLYVTHNEHRGSYLTIDQAVAKLEHADWVSDEERQRALDTDSLWIVQWYPTTPVGFYVVAASTLEACLAAVEKYAE